MRCLDLRRWLGATVLAIAACRLPPDADTVDAGRPPLSASSHASTTHVIAEADHLHVVEISVGDIVESPTDEAFDWRMAPPGPLFEPVAPDAGRVRYRAIEAGRTRLVVDGEPKCFKLDATCGTSRREWTVFLTVLTVNKGEGP